MKVTEKKFLNVHQTLSPLVGAKAAAAASAAAAAAAATNTVDVISAKAAAEKVLVRLAVVVQTPKQSWSVKGEGKEKVSSGGQAAGCCRRLASPRLVVAVYLRKERRTAILD